jgi:hypothetical protein
VSQTAYWIILVENAFSVEVVSPEYHPTTVGSFATASAAKAWITEHQASAKGEPRQKRKAGRSRTFRAP